MKITDNRSHIETILGKDEIYVFSLTSHCISKKSRSKKVYTKLKAELVIS
jgi:hypothetical protein